MFVGSAFVIFFFKQKTAYEMRISDWSSDVCSSDLGSALNLLGKDLNGKIVLFDLKFELPTLGLTPLMEFLWDPALTIVDPSVLAANPYLTNYTSTLERLMNAGAAGFVGVQIGRAHV